MRETVRREMLSLVVLEALGKAQPRIAEADVRAVVPTARDTIQPEDGKNPEGGIVDGAGRPRVARQFSARPVVRLGAKDSDAGRVDCSILGDDVADDVVGERRDDFISGGVQSLREMRRAVEPL